jgi:hypothetical protein
MLPTNTMGSPAPSSMKTPLGGTQITRAPQLAQGGQAADHVSSKFAAVATKDPRIQQAAGVLKQRVGAVPAKSLDAAIKLIAFALKHPDKYPQIRAAAIKDRMLDPRSLPEQFNAALLTTLLATLVGMRNQQAGQGFAKGGLAAAAQQLQSQGRNGDTILAHINPQEAAILRAHGGSGTINPKTGLVEYSWKSWVGMSENEDPLSTANLINAAVATVAPMAGEYVSGWIGNTAMGEALGSTGTKILGQALTGAAGSALTGGNIGQGAVLGALQGGAGDWLSGKVGDWTGMSPTNAARLSAAGVGALSGAITGQGVKQGAIQGVVGNELGNMIGGQGGAQWQAGGRQFSNMLQSGYPVQQAGLSAIATGLMTPAEQAVKERRSVDPNAAAASAQPNEVQLPSSLTGAAPAASPAAAPAAATSGLGMDKIMAGLSLLGGLGGAPAPVKQAVTSLSPSQQEYFNRPLVQWDWDRMQADANQAKIDLKQYMARNWNRITGGEYNKQAPAANTGTVQYAARGGRSQAPSGALSKMAYLAQGSGSGRADTIDAKLSDGEFVVDAETVALLGDGSTTEGARRLNMMREQVRQQKGAALSKGKFSLAAKSPLAYMAGAR